MGGKRISQEGEGAGLGHSDYVSLARILREQGVLSPPHSETSRYTSMVLAALMGFERRRDAEREYNLRTERVENQNRRDEYVLDEMFAFTNPRGFREYRRKKQALLEANLGAEVIYWSGEESADSTLSGNIEEYFDLAAMISEQEQYMPKESG